MSNITLFFFGCAPEEGGMEISSCDEESAVEAGALTKIRGVCFAVRARFLLGGLVAAVGGMSYLGLR